jgi:hypothetical protein
VDALWRDPGAWIAIGVSVLFIIVGLVMHRIFVNVLQNGANPPPHPPAAQTPPSAPPTPLDSHE